MHLPTTFAAAGFVSGLLTSNADENRTTIVHTLTDPAAEMISDALPGVLQTPQKFSLPILWRPQAGGNFKYDVEPIPGQPRTPKTQGQDSAATVPAKNGKNLSTLILALVAGALVVLDFIWQNRKVDQEIAKYEAEASRQLRRAPFDAIKVRMENAAIARIPKTRYELATLKNKLIKIIADLRAGGDEKTVREAEKFLDSLDSRNDEIKIKSAELHYLTILCIYRACKSEIDSGIHIRRSDEQIETFRQACIEIDYLLSHMSGELSERHRKILKDLPRMEKRVLTHNDHVAARIAEKSKNTNE